MRPRRTCLRSLSQSNFSGVKPCAQGFTPEKLDWLKDLKQVRRGRIREYADHFGVEYKEGQRPWAIPCDLAFPCATQNEINVDDAKTLIGNGLIDESITN